MDSSCSLSVSDIFEVAGERAPDRFGNLFQIDHAFQTAGMRLDVLVVVVSHDLRCKVRNAKPHLQVRSAGAASVEIELRAVVEGEDVRIVLDRSHPGREA